MADPWREMERAVECSICLDIFKDPVSVNKCLHTFCKPCVDNLPAVTSDSQEGFECPHCRKFNKRGEYTSSFVAKKYLELYNQRPSIASKCLTCEENTGEWLCVDCKVGLCNSCKETHNATVIGQNHIFQAQSQDQVLFCQSHKDQRLELHCVQCQELVCQKCHDLHGHQGHDLETVETATNRVVPQLDDLVDSLSKDFDYCKQLSEYLGKRMEEKKRECTDLKAKYQIELQRLTEAILAAIEKQGKQALEVIEKHQERFCRQIQTAFDSNNTQMQAKQGLIDLTKTTLDHAHGSKLLKLLQGGFIHELKEEEKKAIFHNWIEVPTLAFCGNPEITENSEFVKSPCLVEDKGPRRYEPENVRTWDIAARDVISATDEEEDEIELEGSPVRLSCVDGNIWVASNKRELQYQIYQTDDGALLQMTCDDLDFVEAFWQINSGEVIAACLNGLFSLSVTGRLNYKISEGKFSDVCSEGDSLVAVEKETCEVHVFHLSSNKWTLTRVFSIKATNQKWKSIHVRKNVLYISYNWTHKIYKYSLDGNYLAEFGEKGKGLGEFSGPFVIGSDPEETLVVCDHNNRRIQLRDSNGDWQELRIQGLARQRDILRVKGKLYVLWRKADKRGLTVYKLNL